MEFLNRVYFQNTIGSYLLAVLVAVVAYAVLRTARTLIRRRLVKIAERTTNKADDLAVEVLKSTRSFFLLVGSLYAGYHLLHTPEQVDTVARLVTVIAMLLQGGIWAGAAVGFLFGQMRQQAGGDMARTARVAALNIVIRVVIWAVVLLLTLDNLGIDITALVAGLGIGGIAVALALQSILGDLFASIAIMMDKPFLLGDFLIVDNFLGSVEHIGIKTTRLRSLSGEQLIFTNSDLLKSRIRNYGRMYERRVLFSLGVTYGTPREKLQAIPGLIRDGGRRTGQDPLRPGPLQGVRRPTPSISRSSTTSSTRTTTPTWTSSRRSTWRSTRSSRPRGSSSPSRPRPCSSQPTARSASESKGRRSGRETLQELRRRVVEARGVLQVRQVPGLRQQDEAGSRGSRRAGPPTPPSGSRRPPLRR